MRNIWKGLFGSDAEAYVFPEAASIEIEGAPPPEPLPPEEEEGAEDWEELFIGEGESAEPGLDVTLPPDEDGVPREEPPPRADPSSTAPVQYAQLQAELMLSQAREDAENILNQAREQAQQELEEIRAGARDEGYRQGYAEGTAKAMEDAIRDKEANAQKMGQEVQAFLEKASLVREELVDQTRDELLDIVIAIAEKIVRVSLKSSSDVIVRMIQSATERMKRQEWVHIYISGCDTGSIAKISPALTASLGALSQHIKVVPMGDDESGTCIIETPEEIIDASASTQMANIRDILTEQLGTQW